MAAKTRKKAQEADQPRFSGAFCGHHVPDVWVAASPCPAPAGFSRGDAEKTWVWTPRPRGSAGKSALPRILPAAKRRRRRKKPDGIFLRVLRIFAAITLRMFEWRRRRVQPQPVSHAESRRRSGFGLRATAAPRELHLELRKSGSAHLARSPFPAFHIPSHSRWKAGKAGNKL
mgnify:CR=1 FL=1